MSTTEYTKIDGIITRETAAALLFTIEDFSSNESSSHWFPLSQIKSIVRKSHDVTLDELDTIEVANWLLKQKGLI